MRTRNHRDEPAIGAPGPPLPSVRGPLSGTVLAALRCVEPYEGEPPPEAHTADPWGEDLHLALYTLYELHYRGFADTGAEHEWDPALLQLRRLLENRFLAALREEAPGSESTEALAALLADRDRPEDPELSRFLARHAELGHLREYAALRSLYHLKEADPHAWVIPRLHGQAKAAFVAVEYDEFGAGRGEDVHACLFADLMTDLGLDDTYGAYLDRAPASMLAVVNLMSLFGLHRAWRGALVGHFAHVETTSSPASRQLAAAMRRTGAGPAAERFYTEHVEADAVHEQVVRHQVVGPLLADEPWLEPDVSFGVEATTVVENRFAVEVLSKWSAGLSALRTP